MKKAERFSIYRHSFVYGNNLIVTKQFIVLNHADGTRTFTDFHRYVENPNKKVKKFNEDGNNRFIFINKFLNYAFFTIGISSLSDLTIDIGRNFLNAYGMHELPDDDEYVHRGKGTVEKCIKAVLDFYINATFELIKAHGDIFTFFIAWLKLNHKTAYQKDYVLNKRYTMDIQNEAYDFDDYISLLYYLFSEDYIENNEMFRKAAESKNYTDTWLYLALHFIRPLRMTDMERIYHPILPYSSEEVIEKIKNDEFSDNDARYVLLSITKRMNWLPLTPNKTASSSDVIPISFDIPTSCETLIGKLFALAQAHRKQAGTPDAPIVRKVSTYQEINRYMGEEIGGLFLNNDFRSRSATKSFLQDIYMVADENIPADGSGYHVKGYYLAAYVRSHKGSYGHIAATTFEYLKDAKFNKLTPEFVAFELLERGVFSFMSSMLLKMTVGEKFDDLSPRNQTNIIKLVDLSPKEIETVVNTVDRGMQFAKETIYSLITEETDILSVLHRIGSGEAFSKQSECLCLMSALEKLCPYATKRNCIGCKYEISTRSTLFLLIEEYNRIRNLYSSTKDTLEKAKYKNILLDVIAPKMDEMLCAIRENYEEEIFMDYEKLIKENT